MLSPGLCYGSQLQEVQNASNSTNYIIRLVVRRKTTNRTVQPTIVSKPGTEDQTKIEVSRFHNNLHKRFRVRHRKQDRLITRSLGCGSLAKCGNTRLEGVQLRDERAPLEVRVLHHGDAALRSNLKTIPKAVPRSLVRLGARRRSLCTTP